MAAGTVIGSLRVVLGADTAAFETGLKGASKELQSFGKAADAIGKTVGLVLAGAITAIGVSVGKMINQADELGKASQKFGIPVENLSALKYAADLADVSFESLGKGLGKLSKAMLEGAVNPTSEAAKNFQALGISVKDSAGNIKTSEAMFTDIAQKFSQMEDGAAKTAMAIRIFGKAGADLIPLLNAGRDGIRALMEEAKQLGIVISADVAAKAEQFNDNMKRLHTIVDALALQIAAALLPAMIKLQEQLISTAKEGNNADGFFKRMNDTILTTMMEFQALVVIVASTGQAFKELWTIISSGLDFAAKGAAVDRLLNLPKQMADSIAAVRRSFMSLGEAGAFESMDNLSGQLSKVKQGFGGVSTAALGTKNALESFLESQKKSIAGHEAEALAIGLGVGAKEKLKIQLEAVQIAMSNGITITAAYRAQIVALSNDAANAAIRLAGAQMAQDALTPWELYKQKLQDVNAVLAKHPEYAEAAKVASMKAAASMIQAYGDVFATAAGHFADFFKTFAKGNKEMFLISKAFAISQTTIQTYVAATRALAELGPVLGPIAAAGIVAAGLANVAKIVAEKPPAMATGGAMTIPGSGGIDSRMVQFMGSPGETVRVDQNKYGEGGSSRTITLAGVNARDYYRGDVLRDFVANLNEAIGDGLKIKLA